MFLKKRAIEHALTEKLRCEMEDGRHRVFIVSLDGQVVAKTHTSHGADEDLGDDLIKHMANQLRVSRRLFVDIVSRKKSLPEYEAEFRR